MPPERILPAQFMHVSAEIRKYLSDMWKIPRSGVTEVRDQDVVSDGHTYDDLAVITLDLMNEYIGSEETFARAWEISVAKAYSELHPPVGIIKKTPEVVPQEVPQEVPDVVISDSVSATQVDIAEHVDSMADVVQKGKSHSSK